MTMSNLIDVLRSLLALVLGFTVMAGVVTVTGELVVSYASIGDVPMGSPVRYTPSGLAVDLIRMITSCLLGGITVAATARRWWPVTTLSTLIVLLLLPQVFSGTEPKYPAWV